MKQPKRIKQFKSKDMELARLYGLDISLIFKRALRQAIKKHEKQRNSKQKRGNKK